MYPSSIFAKTGAAPETAYSLKGRLYVSESGWGLLSVPNSIVRGCFDAIQEPGVELPLDNAGKLNAHISVFRPEELEKIGGADLLTERGHTYSYTFGRLCVVSPNGWPEYSKVWMIEVRSPELERLRKSYGLSRVPHFGEHEFHITIARRRKGVLQANTIRKAAEAIRSRRFCIDGNGNS